MSQTTVAEYADQNGLNPGVARARLNELVAQGKATVSRNSIIGYRNARGGSRGTIAAVRGNVYEIAAPEKPQ